MAHAQPSETEQLSYLFELAAASFYEVSITIPDRFAPAASVDRQTKTFNFQCAAGGAEKIAEFTKRYARTPEYAACKRGDEDYQLAIVVDERFRNAVERCIEALEAAEHMVGIAAERIILTLKRLLKIKAPDLADTLRVQCEAAARLCKLEAAH